MKAPTPKKLTTVTMTEKQFNEEYSWAPEKLGTKWKDFVIADAFSTGVKIIIAEEPKPKKILTLQSVTPQLNNALNF